MIFVRRYMSDKVHRLRPISEHTYCGKPNIGQRMKKPTKVGRCEACRKVYEKEKGMGVR